MARQAVLRLPVSHLTPRRARLKDLPPAPWAPVPLVELCILAGIVLAVAGFRTAGDSGVLLVVTGLVLVTVSTLEQTLREHLAGYRSHTVLLSSTVAVTVGAALFLLTPVPQLAILAVAGAVFAVLWRALREAFRRRSGGVGFRA